MKYATTFATIFAAGVVLHLFFALSTGRIAGTSKLEAGRSSSNTATSYVPPTSSKAAGNLNDVYNRTLGFQEIFVVSLPERSDRRDAFRLQASVTDISYTFTNAVLGKNVPTKAQPWGMHREPAEVGCWRSHLNIMQYMVQHRIQTALIFEDDADWEVALKAQLFQAARGARWLLDDTEDKPSHSPYGDGWDVLWLGHSGVTSIETERRRWVVARDPTVTPPKTRTTWFEPKMETWEVGPAPDTQTRIYFVSGLGYGSSAWALTLAGAEKVLYELSLNPFNDPIDSGMGKLCAEHKSNLTCIAPFPAVVGISKPAGPLSRGSDILSGLDKGGEVRKKPGSERTVFSTRLNMRRILNGSTEYESQYPAITGKYMTLEQIGRAVGHGEVLPPI
ncbi:hypothetical protein PV05_06758 [Exophiala xenobiotica]|uniref:Glycosyl transferase family 25 domain-containing protein n=1 Tax=Exophiala xenobiotica TaxID=348802 RepID=A0A0D2EG23_9EURO|nr:uncharacterized protein PV05_06758 [Exophiala xenobiotica]KIW54398.1 hypothetical protein PV05_06758 [Exophiala xenobiotica]